MEVEPVGVLDGSGGRMMEVIRLSYPADYEDRTIIPLIRDNTLISDNGGIGNQDPVGLVIIEQGQAWLGSLLKNYPLRPSMKCLGLMSHPGGI